jgi:endoglucanase
MTVDRRSFLKNTSLAALSLGAPGIFTDRFEGNLLPRWRGFNLLDFFNPNPNAAGRVTKPEYLKWIRDWGFDFVRIPIAYPYYLDIDRNRNITPDDVYKIDKRAVERIDKLVRLANEHSLHVSINLHRAPGYCINAGFHEPFNLWKDKAAQDAFYFHWNMWAAHFRSMPKEALSFDLVNEPSMREDMNDQHSKSGPVPGDVYRLVASGAAEAIRKENPQRLIIADGNNVGNTVIPEIMDLNIAQSCRGYFPGAISHYKAPWAMKNPDQAPLPVWPGEIDGKPYDRRSLEKYYQPWVDLMKKGVGVHCGECGCWNKTPHNVFLAWFGDVMDILKSNGIGYAIWEFSGDFGIMNSRRADVEYADWYGEKLDKKYLQLLQRS